jgi:GST-like protein
MNGTTGLHAAHRLDLEQGQRRPLREHQPPDRGCHPRQGPAGRPHPLQLYSLGTPNGVKVTVMLEELLALGHTGAEYDAWLIRINEGDQFGSGFVAVNPNSKIPALLDRSGEQRRCACSSRAPSCSTWPRSSAPSCRPSGAARAECLSWLFWQMGSAPFLGGGFGHFYAYAPSKIEYAIDRYRHGSQAPARRARPPAGREPLPGGQRVHHRRHGRLALVRHAGQGQLYEAGEFLRCSEYKNVLRWTDEIAQRPAVQRGRMVNRTWGQPTSQLHERHDAGDFDTKTHARQARQARLMNDNILVFYGSYRSDRMGVRLADYIVSGLRARGDNAELIDAKAVDLPRRSAAPMPSSS